MDTTHTSEDLEVLRKLLQDHTSIWWIASAMRGPDSDMAFRLKNAITGVIRYKLGLRDDLPGTHFIVQNDCAVYREIRMSLVNPASRYSWLVGKGVKFAPRNGLGEGYSTHFIEHALLAFAALGLKWDEVNEARPAEGHPVT